MFRALLATVYKTNIQTFYDSQLCRTVAGSSMYEYSDGYIHSNYSDP
jgi:hypothetical protein